MLIKIQFVNNPTVVSYSKDVDLCDFQSRRLPNSVDQTVMILPNCSLQKFKMQYKRGKEAGIAHGVLQHQLRVQGPKTKQAQQ